MRPADAGGSCAKARTLSRGSLQEQHGSIIDGQCDINSFMCSIYVLIREQWFNDMRVPC
jgi:hypothetical protein